MPNTGSAISSQSAPGGYRSPRILGVLASTLSGLAGIGIAALVILTVLDVAARQFRGSGIPGAVEITEVGLVAVVFLGMMGALVNDRHVKTPLLTNRLPSGVTYAVRIVVTVLAIFLLLWLVNETTVVAMESVRDGEFRYGVTQVPIWPARIAVVVGLIGLTLAMIDYLVRTIADLRRGQPAEKADLESSL